MNNVTVTLLVITLFLLGKYNSFETIGAVAGNRTIAECSNGGRPDDSDTYMTTTEVIRRDGYRAEEHVVITKDRYVLTMHRIPGAAGASPVFLQHGVLMSSYDWVVTGRGKSLAYLLADRGYDVWLGNARGSTYSRCHLSYTPANYSFWNFSWHEMGVYDLPAEIDHVAKVTKQNITYIGYSMGTTMFYVMASEKPQTAAKVKAMFGLAPIAHIYHARSPLKYVARFTRLMQLYGRVMGSYEFLSQAPVLKKTLNYFCNLFELQKKICVYSVFALIGFNSPQFNYTMLPQILTHTPAGTSLKAFIHYFQENVSGGFHKFDYGEKNNLMLYNSTTPPSYDVSKIQVPIGVFWSDNDFFVHPKDVQTFYDKVPNQILNYKVENPSWNHIDYVFGLDVVEQVYSKLLSAVDEYR